MLESLISNSAFGPVAIVVGRNLVGWVQNSLKDGEIQPYEWNQLIQTTLRLGAVAVLAYFGVGAVVEGISATDATAMAGLADLVKGYFKK
ncbi:MAG: hypothetical protein HYS80_01235 [Candidatus Aenigmarchaeota archaeon]|nr:hypothetical protein [Candidatus Aenigmarchaeota archaeon]